MAENDADLERIRKLVEMMKANGLIEVEIQHGDERICLKRFVPQVSPTGTTTGAVVGAEQRAQVPVEAVGKAEMGPEVEQEEELVDIKSPIVGTFYEAPSPDSEPYVEIGSHVEPQTVVCIIEAMKVMNEIKAETSGTIVEKLVRNGQAVEYGQVLFRVKLE